MSYIEEYKKYGTIGAHKEGGDYDWSVALMFKDAKGQATLKDKIAIKIVSLLLYNNVDYIDEQEILEKAQEILELK